MDLDPLPDRRVERTPPLQLRDEQDGLPAGDEHEERQALEGRRVVPAEVPEVGRRAHEGGGEPPVPDGSQRSADPVQEAIVHQIFIWIGWEITSTVSGVVPTSSPSASTGSARSASMVARTRDRISTMCGCGTWSPR